jgi:fluoroacetyl-CoA thioesterase
MTVEIHARLESVEGRRLVFAVKARDDIDAISEGRHERHVIDAARFEQKLAGKRESAGKAA